MQGQQPLSEFNNAYIQPLQTSAITDIVQHLRRPGTEIKKFGGNPIEFPQFMRQFLTKLVSCTSNDDERLNYLEQYTYGQPNKIVCGYSYLEACIAYPAVVKELEERYGDPNIIGNAFVKRALDWPTIKSDNPSSLDEFGIFLTECLNAIRGIDAIQVLQYPDNMKKLIRKLPYHLHDRWRNVVQKHRDNGDEVNFKHLVDFVKLEGKKSTDPLYGKDALLDNSRKESIKHSSSSYSNNSLSQPRSKGTFTTQTKPGFNSACEPKAKLECEHCNGNHKLKDCQSLYKRPQEERLDAIRNLNLCFACLKPGHFSPACQSRLMCTHCKSYHPSVLHIDYANTQPKTAAYVTHGSYTRAGEANSDLVTMPIIPVKVTTTDGLVVVDTYAFMDQGSSVCFITNSLMEKLGIFALKTHLNIETMHGSNFISSILWLRI
ncbi:uncharacterized protein LOC126815871 [Patella vulgata]|uniref:uncharacterized protein LOC126815871 n=1 Tax=Patella vulgata TaxID=6465 RepID=UPI00217F48AB|nr:uncharacterized protein LOC126815871 [Patella vulgata]